MKIIISSGHGKLIRGASGYIDEVDEARRVVESTAGFLRSLGVGVETFHDNTSTSQNQNLSTIVNFHNSKVRDLDVSVHFNAYQTTSKPMGTECLWVTQQTLAGEVATAIAGAGMFINRGAKKRTDLYFLNNTHEPAILIETCFVDSSADTNLYHQHYDNICEAIAEAVSGRKAEHVPPPLPPIGRRQIPDNQKDIICTEFGGGSDPNNSAYAPYDVITDSEKSVALPWRFPEPCPEVRVINRANGKEVICKIRDIGPWLTDDPYWDKGTRPLAELCWEENVPLPRGPNKGKVPNGAGIDITPAAAKAIGVSGKGDVDWDFIRSDLTS